MARCQQRFSKSDLQQFISTMHIFTCKKLWSLGGKKTEKKKKKTQWDKSTIMTEEMLERLMQPYLPAKSCNKGPYSRLCFKNWIRWHCIGTTLYHQPALKEGFSGTLTGKVSILPTDFIGKCIYWKIDCTFAPRNTCGSLQFIILCHFVLLTAKWLQSSAWR